MSLVHFVIQALKSLDFFFLFFTHSHASVFSVHLCTLCSIHAQEILKLGLRSSKYEACYVFAKINTAKKFMKPAFYNFVK